MSQVHIITAELTKKLNITQPELLVLELAALNYWSNSRKEFLLDALDYFQQVGRNESLGEVDGCLTRLVGLGLLEQSAARWVCPVELAGDVAANAVLERRFPYLMRQRDRQGRGRGLAFYSTWERERLYFHVFGHQVTHEAALGVVEKLRYPESLAALPEALQTQAMLVTLPRRISRLESPGPLLEMLGRLHERNALHARALTVLGEFWLLQGRAQEFERLLALRDDLFVLRACRAFLEADYSGAHKLFAKARVTADRTPCTSAFSALLEHLAGFHVGEWQLQASRNQLSAGFQVWLEWLANVRQSRLHPRPETTLGGLGVLLLGAIAHWEGAEDLAEEIAEEWREMNRRAATAGYTVLADLFQRPAPLYGCLSRDEGWVRQLKALLELQGQQEDTGLQERLVWILEQKGRFWELEPKVQKRGKKGWTAGRSITYNGRPPHPLSKQDEQALDAVREGRPAEAWTLLAGHPLVFFGNRRVELSLGQPELVVRKGDGRIHLTMVPNCLDQGVGVVVEAPGRIKVIKPNAHQEKVATILGRNGMSLPESQQETVQVLLASLSAQLSIASEVQLDSSLEEREADPRAYLRLSPLQNGLQMQAVTRPFGEDGPSYPAGTGAASLVVRLEGRSLQVVRDLQRERQILQQAELDGPGPWFFPDPQSSLELLEKLDDLDPGLFKLEWPEGRTFSLKKRVSSQDFAISVKSQEDWLAVSGQLELEGGQRLQLEQLLEMLRQNRGRFLSLGGNEFLALTEEFRQRLEHMAGILEPGRGQSLRLHPLAAGLLEDLPGLKADQAFRERLEKLRQVESLQVTVPVTLEAELRDYQRDGFQWLAQRAEWGVGACLADDMGLGKTLQSLALLVLRAPSGPALVVAPTSVGGNWLQEAARFAPTLRLHDLRVADREQLLENVGPFDVVIASYGLLTNEVDRLAAVEWQTLILDEAQAIKNTTSQRFKAARRLPAAARIATTGTPVENRLDELWALFRFLNPGLLGSLESFRSRFDSSDRDKRALLRRLVHPFILRRTKAQVLKELPPRTEITLEVELFAEERIFYEALRRQAVEQLEVGQAEPMAVLVELTRLRRACCHPSLVDPAQVGGSKLEAMLELVEELRQGGHRALIFSQFVDHLAIIRAELDRRGLSYQYLDGSTPARERTRRVADFQAGQGDLFLISLKAGGVGLNLTGADYVIHMDPWWNPAVEDQASDRAHRIGQLRPVTIYRLVAAGTIENKIVALHAQKRELAESLLEGADAAVRLNTDELLSLLRQ